MRVTTKGTKFTKEETGEGIGTRKARRTTEKHGRKGERKEGKRRGERFATEGTENTEERKK